jgi:hypothetical protein
LSGTKAKVLVLDEVRAERARVQAAAVPASLPAAHPLYGVALLKMAMELKKPGAPALEDVLKSVTQKMNLPEAELRAFLAQNGGLLRSLAPRRQS